MHGRRKVQLQACTGVSCSLSTLADQPTTVSPQALPLQPPEPVLAGAGASLPVLPGHPDLLACSLQVGMHKLYLHTYLNDWYMLVGCTACLALPSSGREVCVWCGRARWVPRRSGQAWRGRVACLLQDIQGNRGQEAVTIQLACLRQP